MNKPNLQLLDVEFDAIPTLVETSTVARQRIRPTPHCDCIHAVEAHLGKGAKRSSDTRRRPMCPVTPKAVSPFLCPYCAHHVFHTISVNKSELLRTGRKSAGRVIGINTTTNERLEFNSIHEATKAGFLSAKYGVTIDREINGWVWTRTA